VTVSANDDTGNGSKLSQSISSTIGAPAPKSSEVFSTRSILAVLLGTLVLRIGSSIAGGMIQFYFGYIDRTIYPLSDTMRGVALALFFLPELLGAPVLGAWSDRFGRKFFIQFAALCGIAGSVITGLTTNFALLVLMRLFGGLSTASQFPATLGYLSDATAHSESLRGRVMGFFQIVTIGGTVGGIFLGGRLWDAFGQNGFLIAALVYLISFFIFTFGIAEPRSARKFYIPLISGEGAGRQALRESFSHYRAVLLEPIVLRFAPAWLAINMILGVWMNHTIGQLMKSQERFPDQTLVGILSQNAQAGQEVATYGALLVGSFGIGVAIWSFMMARWRRTSIMLVAVTALFFLCAILFALNHSSLSAPIIPGYLIAGFVLLFIISGAMPAALTYLADVTETHASDRGAIMGIYTIFFGVGGFLGTLIGGPFAQRGSIDGILLITTLLAAVATVALIQLHRFEINSPSHDQTVMSEK